MSPTRLLRPQILGLFVLVSLGCTDHGLKIHESPPTATLLSPGDNESFLEGSSITFRAQLDDNDDGVDALEVAWRSDTLGTLRGETTLADDGIQEFVTDELERGPHVITVTATDPDGNTSTDDVVVSVMPNTPPSIGFSIPTDNAPYGVDDDVVAIVVVDDAEDSPEALRLDWTLNDVPHADGAEHADELGDAMVVLSGLDIGSHSLSVRVRDALGETAVATVQFRVIPLDGDGDGINTGELGGEDCDDENPEIGPGAIEICDGIDNDCDGRVDADDDDIIDAIEGYPDLDGDGFGDDSDSILTCDLTELSDVGGDCNDFDALVHPGAMEVCGDGLDNDCDGSSGACKWTGDSPVTAANHLSLGSGAGNGIAQSLAGGDLNGDGQDDLIIGAAGFDASEMEMGAVYIIQGPLEESVGDVETQATFVIDGMSANAQLGSALSVGDFNTDGSQDLIIGAPGTHIPGLGMAAGEAYIFFDGVASDCSSDDADVTISASATGQRFGARIATQGDLDGDGLNDVLISSPEDSTYDTDAGAVAVFLGDTPLSGNLSVDDRDTQLAANDNNMMFGYALEYVGDVNGDGRDDVLIGSPGARANGINTGAAYLFLGHATNFSTGASRFHSAANATYDGVAMRDEAGTAVTGLGDIDADGYDEFAISAPLNDDNATNSGAVYLMIDPERTGVHSVEDAADTILRGPRSTDRIGESLTGDIDMDNDGVSDLIIGAPEVNIGTSNSQGKAFLIYGPITDLESGDLGEEFGLEDGSFTGESIRDQAGDLVLGGHDWSGDGIKDLAVTAPGISITGGASDSGGVFVFFGRGM
jgi:hypothetical protein